MPPADKSWFLRKRARAMITKNLTAELVQVTELAALAAYNWIGYGDEKSADQAAVDAMRQRLNLLDITGTIVIGEGERDCAPMLYIGERVGKGGIPVDIALDPLEGTTICAHYRGGAMSVLAVTSEGNFLNAPDVYMEKIAVGANLPDDLVSLNNSVEENIRNLSKAKRCDIKEIKVIILNRPRHAELISRVRKCGARIKLIDDGDVAAVISVARDDYDIYLGSGGAPEGVLAAAAICSIGGQMQGRLVLDSTELLDRAKKIGISDPTRIYSEREMVSAPSILVASGVTTGSLLPGIKYNKNADKYFVHSVVISPSSIMKITNEVSLKFYDGF